MRQGAAIIPDPAHWRKSNRWVGFDSPDALRLERLPPYAPDRNPVAAVWSWLKWGRLANFVPDDLGELDDWVVEYLIELKHHPELLRALWERSDLPFPDSPQDE